MFRALLEGLIDTEGLDFRVETRDTDTLNQMASGGGPDVTAISIAHYPAVAAHYQLFNHGGSMGRNYGPVLIARQPRSLESLARRRVGVPGLGTTAALVLRLAAPEIVPVVIPISPPQRSFEALRSGEVEAIVLIHEGRLTYRQEGFANLLDLGEWWQQRTGLPLPLGGNVIRRDLGPTLIAAADRLIHRSIQHALSDREAAIGWLLKRGGPLDRPELVDTYLSLYANADTLDWGDDGRAGIRALLAEGAAAGLIAPVAGVDLVGGEAGR